MTGLESSIRANLIALNFAIIQFRITEVRKLDYFPIFALIQSAYTLKKETSTRTIESGFQPIMIINSQSSRDFVFFSHPLELIAIWNDAN